MCATLSCMFTGIITDIGELVARDGGRFTIRSAYAAHSIAVGASISCDGACLTATSVRALGAGSTFTLDVSNETLLKTSLEHWQPGRKLNLERALQVGAELGGHLVSGHVDGVARLVDLRTDGQSRRFVIEAPEELAHYIAPKGSVALDGVSLTVNEVAGDTFAVLIIPHTLQVTTLGKYAIGAAVNLEVDLMVRYAARLMEGQ